MKKLWIAIGISGLVGALIAVLILFFGPPKAAGTRAKDLAYALLSGDPGQLKQFIATDDRKVIHMTDAQLDRFLSQYVAPKLKGCSLSQLRTKSHRTNMMGYADFVVTTPKGKTFDYHCGVTESDDGYVYPLREIVMLAWRVEYLDTHSVEDTTSLAHLSSGYYLERDIARLNMYGYTAHPYPEQSYKTASFATCLAYQYKFCQEHGLKW